MRVLVYLCTSIYRGCSDRAKHLEIAANAPEIIVVCIATHNSIKYDYFVVLTDKTFSYLLLSLAAIMSIRHCVPFVVMNKLPRELSRLETTNFNLERIGFLHVE